MGIVTKLIDAINLFFFIMVIAAPLFDAQICLPLDYIPTFLIDLKSNYTRDYGDYLYMEEPHFFVGLVWVELLLQWPFAVASLYGFVAGKPWFPTTCLIYASSTFTSVVATLADMIGSGKASKKMFTTYVPFLGFAVLAFLRGLSLVTHSAKTNAMEKKRA